MAYKRRTAAKAPPKPVRRTRAAPPPEPELEEEDNAPQETGGAAVSGIVAGAVAAKALGIYLGQIYSYIKAGKVTNHKVGGYPDGKGVEVDMAEVRAARDGGRRRGGKGSKGPRPPKERDEEGKVIDASKKAKGLRTGKMLSWSGQPLSSPHDPDKPPRYTIGQVLGSGKHITYMDVGTGKRVHYTGRVIDNVFFGTDRLSLMLAKGVARVEKPTMVLGMILLSWVMDGEMKLAESLEAWMIENEIEVHVPEIVDMPEEEVEEDDEGSSADDDD